MKVNIQEEFFSALFTCVMIISGQRFFLGENPYADENYIVFFVFMLTFLRIMRKRIWGD